MSRPVVETMKLLLNGYRELTSTGMKMTMCGAVSTHPHMLSGRAQMTSPYALCRKCIRLTLVENTGSIPLSARLIHEVRYWADFDKMWYLVGERNIKTHSVN